jgi:hypothetical protein
VSDFPDEDDELGEAGGDAAPLSLDDVDLLSDFESELAPESGAAFFESDDFRA